MAVAVEYSCERCASSAVTRDAWAKWNPADQRWELSELFDHAFCHRCHRETRAVARPYRGEAGEDDAG